MAALAVMTILEVLESTLPPSLFPQKTDREATMMALTVLAVSAVMAVSVVTATPL